MKCNVENSGVRFPLSLVSRRTPLGLVLLSLVLFASVLNIHAQEEQKTNDTKETESVVVELSSKSIDSIDLGKVPLGSEAVFPIALKNDTKRDWGLTFVGQSSSGVSVVAPKDNIPAGSSLATSIELSTRTGGAHKAFITYQFDSNRSLQVPITWTVTHPLVIEPARLTFGEIATVGKFSLQFKVQRVSENGEARDAELVEVSSMSKLIKCSHQGATVQVELDDCGREPDEIASIYIRDKDMKEDESVAFPVSWRRPPPQFVTLPGRFNLSLKGSEATVSFIIHAPESTLGEIENVELVDSKFKVSDWMQENLRENRAKLTVHFEIYPEAIENVRSLVCLRLKFTDGRFHEVFGLASLDSSRSGSK